MSCPSAWHAAAQGGQRRYRNQISSPLRQRRATLDNPLHGTRAIVRPQLCIDQVSVPVTASVDRRERGKCEESTLRRNSQSNREQRTSTAHTHGSRRVDNVAVGSQTSPPKIRVALSSLQKRQRGRASLTSEGRRWWQTGRPPRPHSNRDCAQRNVKECARHSQVSTRPKPDAAQAENGAGQPSAHRNSFGHANRNMRMRVTIKADTYSDTAPPGQQASARGRSLTFLTQRWPAPLRRPLVTGCQRRACRSSRTTAQLRAANRIEQGSSG